MERAGYHLRRQIFIPLLFSLFIMLATSVASVYMIQRLHMIGTIKKNVSGTEQLFPSLLDAETSTLSSHLRYIAQDTTLQEAWLARDRDLLLDTASAIYSDLNSNYSVTHFYFIDVDRVCFLRVHQPDRAGDYIKRITMKEAARKGITASGIELGPLGTFTLRVVQPWFIDGNLAGYIEIGKEILHLTPMLKKSLGIDLIFAINKTYLNRTDWEKGMRMLGWDYDWDLFPDSVVVNSTSKEVSRQIGPYLSYPHKDHSGNIIEFTKKNSRFMAMFSPLTDAGGRDLGDIIVVTDVTELVYNLNMVTLSILSLFILIGLILSGFMYFFVARTEYAINAIQDELITEIDERRQVESELKHHRGNLEQIIQERTHELNSSLSNLKKEVAERRLAEDALRLSEAQFRGVFENSAIGITISDTKGNIITCNDAYREMLGYAEDELKKLNFSALTHSEDIGKQLDLYEELLLGKRDFFKAEKRYVSKDGQVIWGHLTVSLIRDQDGTPLYVIGLIENIGERIQLESERIKASKLESIGILAGGIAHDFNNLLTAIMGNISLAKKFIDTDSKATVRLEQAEKALQRTRELTQQLLTFSKGGEPVKQTMVIGEIIRESASFALRGANVKCRFDIDENLWRAEVDSGQFSQVIQNLIINADHAMPEGGLVTVSARNYTHSSANGLPLDKKNYLKISITDQGPGISEENIHKVFDPYFSTKSEGSGLGLSIVHSVITNHHGHVEVESYPGQGATFNIYLPATRKKAAKQEADTGKVYRGKGRILLMDDEEMIRDFGSELLTELGYEVEVAVDGKEAIKIYSDAMKNGRPFDIVLMDITVPGGMGGKETIRELIAIDPQVKGIVSSGYAEDPIMSNYREYGFVGVVPKPYDMTEISRELHRILNKS